MGYFRNNSLPGLMPTTDSIKRRRTIIDGQWHLLTNPSDSGIVFLACNNEYKEWLWEVAPRSLIFCLFFGSYIVRLERAKPSIKN